MAAKKDRVLWADDEIDLLKPHILFLQDKGYEVIPVISGQDAIECCKEESFDIIFLDENMPGHRIGNIGADQGDQSRCPCRHGDQERGRKHHEPGYR